MSVAARTFFAAVNEDSSLRVPPCLDGTLRFDVREGERIEGWLLRLREGRVHAELLEAPADCVVTVDRDLFDKIILGKEGIESAFVRHALTVEGLLPLLLSFRWLLPDAVGARRPREMALGWTRAR